MRELILARHGESESSVRRVTSGRVRTSAGLTRLGAEQARLLGESLAGEPIDLCATTEFPRAWETADLALDGRDVPRLVVPELNEIDYGAFEGRPLDEYLGWAHGHGPGEQPPGGGESRAQAAARFAGGYRALLERPEATILAIGHGLAVRYALNAARGLPPGPVAAQVEYAEPSRLSAAELERVVEVLAAWSRDPVWPEDAG